MFSTLQKKSKTPPKADDDEDPFQKLKSLMSPQPEAEKEKNHIYFFRDVDSDSCLDLIRKINDVSKELLKYSIDFDCPPPSIFLHINSLGGDLLSAFGVVDCIKNCRVPLVSIVNGQAASAATIISMACHRRFITEHSFMLIHQLSTSCHGRYEEIKEDMQNDTTFMETLYKLYKEHTKMSLPQIKEALKHDLWWDSSKCIEKGLVDGIWKGSITNVTVDNLFGKEPYSSCSLVAGVETDVDEIPSPEPRRRKRS